MKPGAHHCQIEFKYESVGYGGIVGLVADNVVSTVHAPLSGWLLEPYVRSVFVFVTELQGRAASVVLMAMPPINTESTAVKFLPLPLKALTVDSVEPPGSHG